MSADATIYIETLVKHYSEQKLSFSIHHKVELPDGRKAIPGQAFTSIPLAVQTAHYWAQRGHDTFLAMGGEINVGDMGKLYPKAIRKLYNVGACSAIYLDVDVKPGAYATQREAFNAIKDFIKNTGLPSPTMLVASGTGGVHIYWVTSELFPPTEFSELSSSLVNMASFHGLKFDPNCTSDACRLLRIPDTFNFKSNPASPVKLLHSGSSIPLAVLHEKLKVNGTVRLPPPNVTPGVIDVNNDLLQKPKQYPPADVNLAATFCEFLHNTLMANGSNLQGEPQWHIALALAAHCEDGETVAHNLCKNHRFYNYDDTAIKYYEVQNARANNSKLGPPRCSYIKKQGVKECDTCPYFQLDTTPLNIPAYNAKPQVVPSHNPNSDLPQGYYRDKDSTIWVDITDTSNGSNVATCAFPFPFLYNSAFMESGGFEGYELSFSTIEVDKNHPKIIKFPTAAIARKDTFATELARNGCGTLTTEPARKFIMALMGKLRGDDNTLRTINALGWCTARTDGVIGFSYNNTCYFPDKTTRTQSLDPLFAESYCVAGENKYWKDLSALIIGQNRADVNTIIACGFAAPLLMLTGHAGVAIGVWSSLSGLGKTTALSLCQAVWGSTSRMQGLDDTANQVIDTMATLKSMPTCWDEVKGNAQAEKMANIIFRLSAGREKGRLNRSSEQMRQREFETMLIWAANNPLADAIVRATKGTVAGYYRILEFSMDESYTSTLDVVQMTILTAALKRNHGHIGQEYAKFLGANYVKLKDLLEKMQDKIYLDLSITQSERFWASGAACIIVGARLANMLKFTNFDLVGLQNFLYKKIEEFRTVARFDAGDISKAEGAEGLLSEFLHDMAKNIIKTDKIWTARGRPLPGSIKVLNDNPAFMRNDIHIQIAQSPNITLRVADIALGKWAKEKGMAKSAITESFKKHLGAVHVRQGRIGSGTPYVSSSIALWEIDIDNLQLGQQMEF